MGRRCMLGGLLLTSAVGLYLVLFAAPASEDVLPQQRSRHDSVVAVTNSLSSDLGNPKALDHELAAGRPLSVDGPTRLLNFTDFRLVLDPNCNYTLEDAEDWQLDGGAVAKAVWIITSYAGDVSKRSALRRAYADEELRQLGIRRIFLLGTLDEAAETRTGISQGALENESERFRDILQGSFVEAYKNLTYKHLMGLQWATERCADSYPYIIKMDDDIVINLYEAMELLKSQAESNVHDDFLMGYVMEHMTPVRNRASKWFVTMEEFPKAVYPAFLSGWFYVTDMLTALKLVYQSKWHRDYFWIDDLFVTGILRKEAGIRDFVNVKEFFTTDYKFLECCLKRDKGEDRPKYKCDFIVGPDGAQSNLLLNFKKYSQDCYQEYNCTRRPKEQLLKDKCILEYKDSNLDGLSGSAQIEKLP